MDQAAAIARSVKSLWLAHPNLPTLVPGGLVWGAVKAGTQNPYATLDIKLATMGNGMPATTWQTGKFYIELYTLRISVWTSQEVGATGNIQAELYGLLGAYTKLMNLNNNAWTLQITPLPDNLDEDPQRQLGQNVFIASAKYEIALQEQRLM